MSTPDTTVVVVEERRRRFPLPLIAAVAGAALLGGTTFALWTAYGDLPGGTIQAGDLDLELKDTGTFYDVSADRADALITVPGTDGTVDGHEIADPSAWRIVPGDKVAVVYTVDVTLVGDNMVAALSLEESTGAGTMLLNDDMDYSFAVYRAGVEVVSETPLAGSALTYLAAPEAGQAYGVADADGVTVFSMVSSTETFTVVVYGEFDSAAADQDNTTVTDTLGGLAVTLTQVRDSGIGQFS